ncbi:GNAT family N-acetyltransferase [Streptomyces sp. NBC_00576]|uniref:GNAT family N-acetyltransferase n=1 Tax=Streptomyces sp. NBC_00576 TaxID=2903665 RepID=UPI002E823B19|nr:GNAT family N-acetyltransferase [Streptomyces sp. NBC_00576]WUB73542.1 GNAT family N-acetyltransferase [Streptomyces sp. NBC_00576]
MGEVFFRRLSRWQADSDREELADLHVAAYEEPAGEEYRNRERFLARLAEDVQRPGFDMVVADDQDGDDDEPAGVAYGYPLHRDGSWWRGFVGAVPDEVEELTASGKVFAITELMVLPEHRRRGIAGRLQERLLSAGDAELVVVLLDSANTGARAAFRAWGWDELGELRPGAGGLVLQVLTRALPG